MKLSKVHEGHQFSKSLSSVTKFIKLYEVYQSLWKFILMLTWLIFENVYSSLANIDDFMKMAAIILMLTWFILADVCSSSGNNESVYKNDENTLCFKGNPWESSDENHEKEATTTTHPVWGLSLLYKNVHWKFWTCLQKPSEKGRTRSTWLNNINS